jgi:hypothetical protein
VLSVGEIEEGAGLGIGEKLVAGVATGRLGASVAPGWKAMGFRQRPCLWSGRDGGLRDIPLDLDLRLELRPLHWAEMGAASIWSWPEGTGASMRAGAGRAFWMVTALKRGAEA